MTTETESETTENPQDQADANAAFEASFQGKDIPPATQPAEKTESDKEAAAAAQASAAPASAAPATPDKTASTEGSETTSTATTGTTEAAPTTAPSPNAGESEMLKAELRKVYGRIGALTDEISKLKTSKEAEGKPAAATQLELTRMKSDYPELAEILTEDLAKALGGLSAAQADPKAIEEIVSQRVEERVAREAARMRDAVVDDAHPTWRQDLFAEDPVTKAKTPTADYLAWRKTLSAEQANAFESSTNPYQVVRMLNQFYDWKGKAAKAEAEKQERLKAAVTPTGTSRPASTTLSDDEAMRKGFEEGFNS